MFKYVPENAGGTCEYWAQKAIEMAKWRDERILFEFNGVEVSVHPKSYASDIVEIYLLRHELNRIQKKYRFHY